MQQDILLVNPQNPSDDRVGTPLGIASVGAYLIENGYQDRVRLLDAQYIAQKHGWQQAGETVKKEIEKGEVKVIGFSVYQGNVNVPLVLGLLARIKGLDVIFGGHYATLAHKTLAEYATAIVRGDGEITTKELMDSLFGNRDFHGIKGVTFYDGKDDKRELFMNPDRESVDLDKLPMPAIELLPKYDGKDVSVLESVGCVDKCSFCSIHEFHRRPGEKRYRLKSPSRIKSEVERAYEMGAEEIKLIGELTLFQRPRALEIADAIHSYNCEWSADAHPRFVLAQKEILPELKSKGLSSLEMGIESGSQHGLDVYNKQTTVQANEAAIEAATKAGIRVHIDLINFNPYTTMDDLKQNIELMYRHLSIFSLAKDYPNRLYHDWLPIPGTALYEQAKNDGLLVDRQWMQDSFRFRDADAAKVFALLKYFRSRYSSAYKQTMSEAKKGIADLVEKAKSNDVDMLDVAKTYLGLWRASKIPIDVFSIVHDAVSDGIDGKSSIDRYCEAALSQSKPKITYPAEIPKQLDSTSQSLQEQLDDFVREIAMGEQEHSMSQYVKIWLLPENNNTQNAEQTKSI